MRGRVGVLSVGMWRLRAQIQRLTGCKPVRVTSFQRTSFDYVAGWGMKSTTEKARLLAARTDRPYLSIEDGFLRSVRPGPQELPLSLVLDGTGVHYDARRPSDLENLISAAAGNTAPDTEARARRAIADLRHLRISKYNDGAERTVEELGLRPKHRAGRVLVVDQTRGDSSIECGLANADSFQAMLEAALTENPGAEIIVKTHPEVISGRKAGYLGEASGPRIRTISEPVNPWCLMELVDRVYVVTSQLGLEALMAGRAVTCFGMPFYAGWGLTDDRVSMPRRSARPTLEQLLAAAYFSYAHYFNPYDGREISFEEAVQILSFLRDRFLENSQKSICIGLSRWKRAAVERLLDGIGGKPEHAWTISGAIRKAKRDRGRVVVWAAHASKQLERACAEARVPVARIEDGFIRSNGLGALYIPPMSLAIDTRGTHYNGQRASDLEHLLETRSVDPDLLIRASRLRHELVRRGVTKYNLENASTDRVFPLGRHGILVPGQVENDASVLATPEGAIAQSRGESINTALLRAVRERFPSSYIVYKPHPDVLARLRGGEIRDSDALAYADRIVRSFPIVPLIHECNGVATLSSLAGFEALIRDKPVATFGLPFYAGWGLTDDNMVCPRRTRRRTLDELVAITLIVYPRYLHPTAMLPCTPEIALELLGREVQEPDASAEHGGANAVPAE